jgi:polysaccharide export outer membrane protein
MEGYFESGDEDGCALVSITPTIVGLRRLQELLMARNRARLLAVLFLATLLSSGCHTLSPVDSCAPDPALPRELDKIVLPDYRVEPPDILIIEAVRAVPKPPYRVEPLDVLFVQVLPVVQDQPLAGPVTVEPDGTINLGEAYGGIVNVAGKTVPEVKALLEKHLRETGPKIKEPKVTVSLAQSRAAQRISGPHLVRPDGTIALGTYGSVRVTGLTLPEVRKAVEAQLSGVLLDPEVSVDVQVYNSKLYYVILDGGGVGQSVYRLPITGNDTVLDAISQVNGIGPVSSKDRIWVSRPGPVGCVRQVLPVDWRAVSEWGETATNYQLMPGDRVFVASYPLVRADSALARMISPVERVLGVTLLAASTRNTIQTHPNQVNGGGTLR